MAALMFALKVAINLSSPVQNISLLQVAHSAPFKILRVFSRLFDFLFRSASLSADSFLETKDGFRSE